MVIRTQTLLTIFFSYFITWMYKTVPISQETYDFFPFCDVDGGLTTRTWAWFAYRHVSRMLFLHSFYYMQITQFRWFFSMLFWIEAGALVDYLLHYGDNLFFISTFGIDYSVIELAAVTLASIYLIVKNLVK